MKIAFVGPLAKRVPPIGYGSTELILWFLAKKLTEMGHETNLLVPKGSLPICTNSYYTKVGKALQAWNESKWKVSDFDVIHDKVGGHSVANNFDGPFITTEHGTSDPTGPQPCGLSLDQAMKWGRPDIPILYNGIDPEYYRYCEVKEDWILYFGSVQKIKGVVDWLQVMQKTNMPGVIVGNAHEPHCPGYWDNECLPLLKTAPKKIIRFGESYGEQKVNFFAKAKCFLFLPRVREAFGTVLIEALVSGTPVVTWDYGPMKEIVKDGVSGFVVPYEDHKAAAEAVKNVHLLSHYECYQQGLKFSDTEAAKAHLEVYQRVANGERW